MLLDASDVSLVHPLHLASKTDTSMESLLAQIQMQLPNTSSYLPPPWLSVLCTCYLLQRVITHELKYN